MNEQDLATLAHARHELRTPLGHIIGYSEMLLEEVEEVGGETVAAPLRTLHAEARQVLSRLNALLAPPPDGLVLDLGALLKQLVEPAQAIATSAANLRQAAGAVAKDDLLADADKIIGAATRFLELLTSGEFGAPSAPARVHAASSTAPRPAAVPGDAGVILVVDDNSSNRELLSRRLTREGHEVLTAADGRDGLEKLRGRAFDLVLLDVLMPERSGAEVLQELKADPELRHIPVLMISALDEMDTVIRCIELGAEDYLAKPFDTVLLRARVGACLEKMRLRD